MMARQLEHFPNLVAMFFARAAERGDAPFLWSKQQGKWQSISWTDAARQVASLANALNAIGLKRGDRVMLVAATFTVGGVVTGLAALRAGRIGTRTSRCTRGVGR